MRKIEELDNPESCFNKARKLEMIFVLLGRDEAAPVAIRAWAVERVRLGKNADADKQIQQALLIAAQMEVER